MSDIPADHPRAASLRLRETIEHFRQQGLVAEAGPIAHGRGEAFDYLLGEATPPPVEADIRTAAALLLEAKRPVISVNGNTAVLAPEALVDLSRQIPAPLEVNVFYGRTGDRERKIADHLMAHGAATVLGVDPTAKVPRLESSRGRVDKEGIAKADVVVVPLEDGDRTQALVEWGKQVIAIDLNPLSRTAQCATLNICDNLVRALPLLTTAVQELRDAPSERAELVAQCDNDYSTSRVLRFMAARLKDYPLEHGLIQVRAAQEADVPFIVSATEACVAEGAFSPAQSQVDAGYVHQRLRMEGVSIGIATFGGKPCGYADGEVRDDLTFHLARLTVVQRFRWLGIGGRLLGWVEEVARSQECQRIVLEVPVACRRAQALCAMHEFNPKAPPRQDECEWDYIEMGKQL